MNKRNPYSDELYQNFKLALQVNSEEILEAIKNNDIISIIENMTEMAQWLIRNLENLNEMSKQQKNKKDLN